MTTGQQQPTLWSAENHSGGSSPAHSCSSSSADAALFELLGLTELSTLVEDQSCLSASTDGGGDSTRGISIEKQVEALTPPKNCLRPDVAAAASLYHNNNTNNDAVILLRIPNALSPAQCGHIIARGYQATNDRGKHYGPQYVQEAAAAALDDVDAASFQVRLDQPNHHKVCVFKDDTILTWLNRIVAGPTAQMHITKWWRRRQQQQQQDRVVHRPEKESENDNNDQTHDFELLLSPKDYIINPRLRLLRYDAIDEDVFLPHYDATTTTTTTTFHTDTVYEDDSQPPHHHHQETTTTCRRCCSYESYLTILCYLNTDFVGGETLFLDSLHPITTNNSNKGSNSNNGLTVTPQTGQIIIFNHELYHASNRLVYDESIQVQRGPLLLSTTTMTTSRGVIRGGTKFVLRSDVMFATTTQQQSDGTKAVPHHDTSGMALSAVTATTTTTTTVGDIVLQPCYSPAARDALDDFMSMAVHTFLVPGRETLTSMLTDLGMDDKELQIFLHACEEATVVVGGN